MQHKGTVRLETDRLILRRFRLDDSGAAFQNWTSDKRVTEFCVGPHTIRSIRQKRFSKRGWTVTPGTTSTNGRSF